MIIVVNWHVSFLSMAKFDWDCMGPWAGFDLDSKELLLFVFEVCTSQV